MNNLFKTKENIEEEFLIELDPNIEILFAQYTYEDYYGSAFVLFTLNGELFEAHGDHCSCHGLQGQWKPEKTSKEYLLSLPEHYWDDRPGALTIVQNLP